MNDGLSIRARTLSRPGVGARRRRTGARRRKARAWLLLVTIVAMTLGIVYMLVLFNDWNKQFFDALEKKNAEDFFALMLYFCFLAAVFIVALDLPRVPPADARSALAHLAHAAVSRRVAGAPRVLPPRARPARHRQPGPAHRRGPAALHDRHAHAGPGPPARDRDAGLVRRHPVERVRAARIHRRREPR